MLDVQNELALAVMRAVTTSIGDTGALDRNRLPTDATGKPNLMKAIVATALGIARFLPSGLS
ncbi:hypothetical protein ADILRU_0192 [Leifsonia rubra CMS 76R]|uniref:Uncharacterized protein n=1 Tax=Rhodoglobus vestalii TaxID=193384 RepID=A0A8H2KBD3_9MICO|nr:hypothetical protein [Rhodoglobus vestalii]EPR77493.1 hypothetical protein ADILRU_0192 [Leifsonia rubra CMS 76R]TQO20146.1 hypothetical protein FB472_1761 [Rhodoglobus vestalii]